MKIVETHCENSYPKGGDAIVTLGTCELSRAWTQLS
jgi:hypothetical protein